MPINNLKCFFFFFKADGNETLIVFCVCIRSPTDSAWSKNNEPKVRRGSLLKSRPLLPTFCLEFQNFPFDDPAAHHTHSEVCQMHTKNLQAFGCFSLSNCFSYRLPVTYWTCHSAVGTLPWFPETARWLHVHQCPHSGGQALWHHFLPTWILHEQVRLSVLLNSEPLALLPLLVFLPFPVRQMNWK